MQTRSKSGADAASRLRTRRQRAKKNVRLDDDTHMPIKSSVSPAPAPPARRSRNSSQSPTNRSRRVSHDSGGEGKPNSTWRVHVTKSRSHHRSPSPNSGVGHHDHKATATTGTSPTSTGDSPRRQSVRRAVLDKQPKPTTIFRHHLFLEPTLARQAKKRKQKERERRSADKATGDGTSRTAQQPPHHHDDDSDNDNLPIRLLVNSSKHESGSGPTTPNHTETFGFRKRAWGETGMKQREDSPLPSAAKVPRRKMSAMVPGPDRAFQVATFRRSRDEELPEGAKELIAQADMARQKKKKPKHWPSRHNSHSPCHFLETGLSPSPLTHPRSESCRSRDVEGDDGALLRSPPTKSHTSRGKKSKRKKKKTSHDGARSVTINNPSMDNLLSQRSSDWAGDVILQRRQYAIDFLSSAHDISSIYAGIVVINDLYSGDDFAPSVARIVIQAQAMGIILLTESLTALLAKQKEDEDFNVSSLGARLLVQRLIDHLTTTLMDDMSLHPEKMLGSGLSTSEVGLASPILRGVVDEIRQVFLALSEEVLAMGEDHGAS